jgi:transcriptional regulator with XRE-family HTH domain
METVKKQLGKNIAKARKAAGFTQQDVADHFHVCITTASGWERGRCEPDMDVLFELADLFGVSIHRLIDTIKPSTDSTLAQIHTLAKTLDAATDVDILINTCRRLHGLVAQLLDEKREEHMRALIDLK